MNGDTNSREFPVTTGAYDRTYNGNQDCFITKLNPTGSALVYSTYLGGSLSDSSAFNSIAIDGPGNVHVSGSTSSTNFPTTSGAFDRTHNGSLDATVTKLNAAGSALAYSTYLGGSARETARGLVLDAGTGAAFVVGRTISMNFPTTPGAFDLTANGGDDGFLTQFDASGGVLYSTYFGGTAQDWPQGVARSVDGTAADTPSAAPIGNRVFFYGLTASLDLPLAGSPLQPAHAGGTNDGFVVRFDF